jgi:pimeloyl-ACP methyl ester carboxylesterase
MRRHVLLLAAIVLTACQGPKPGTGTSAQQECTHFAAERQVQGRAICEDIWTCGRPPFEPHDLVAARRVAACNRASGPVLLFLPGMHMTGAIPETDPANDLRLDLAVAGIRSWSLDYRTHAIPPIATQTDMADVARWDADTFLGDARWAVSFVRGLDAAPVHVAGFSYGAALAYALAAEPNHGIESLVILDGAPSAGRGAPDGPAVMDVGTAELPYEARERLLRAVIRDPANPSPVPGYGEAGQALADILFASPRFGGNGGLSAARDGVSNIQVVARLLVTYDRWWPRAALDVPAAKAPSTPVPVLAFSSSNIGPGWVERVGAGARTFGGADALVVELPGFGQLDVLTARTAARQVHEPVREWLTAQGG